MFSTKRNDYLILFIVYSPHSASEIPFPHTQLREILVHSICLYTHATKCIVRQQNIFLYVNNQLTRSIFLRLLFAYTFYLYYFDTRTNQPWPLTEPVQITIIESILQQPSSLQQFSCGVSLLITSKRLVLTIVQRVEVGLAYWYFDVHD
ncbi:Hypothetical_protein [Hexamita inflata]|uniref:Hypothetical_protein n=1 Tax=Hexamita inflata TaxID=28002 RepID=A0ABP1KAX3_9EUKA